MVQFSVVSFKVFLVFLQHVTLKIQVNPLTCLEVKRVFVILIEYSFTYSFIPEIHCYYGYSPYFYSIPVFLFRYKCSTYKLEENEYTFLKAGCSGEFQKYSMVYTI